MAPDVDSAKRLLWDFFGPHAERTASHFRTHLEQFLTEHGLAGLQTGLESAGAGHHAVFCVAEGQAFESLKASLRPNRVL
jgi:hypothetical protein